MLAPCVIGECLVLFTQGASGSHIMRKYDIRRKNGRAIWMYEQEPFTSSTGEVNRAKFSPDTIYLAVARNDNVTHVYDSRMIGRGVLHAFKHSGAARNIPGSDPYGIMEAYWVDTPSRRLGLITGGTDGMLLVIAHR
jgi:WD40 repeat protein